ncbi:MAG: putative signaling protein [Solirubrobacterales bacterium]|nr:putative signaling protein [Solirubrobacterales bacterium]
MFFLSPTGIVLSWNRGAEAIKGWSADEIIGESFVRFYPPEAVAVGHPERELEIAALTGRYEEEGWRVRKDGSHFWARVVITAMRDDNDHLMAFGKVTTDLTERKRAEEQLQNVLRLLEQTVRLDHLTGLPNRRAWDERLQEEIGRARRDERPLMIAMIDIDHFKRVNDQHGHAVGDRLLKQAALSWQRALRPTDVLSRYGGEEFALALPGCFPIEARAVVRRLMAATPSGHTCSVGITQWDGAESPDQVLGRADQAMYAAKTAGRACAVVAEP